MKPSLLPLALLFAVFPASLPAAPGEVNTVVQKIANGLGGLPGGTSDTFGTFGFACAALGDLDGDGNPDLAVAQQGIESVRILFLAEDGSVDRSVRIANGSGGLPAATVGSNFGSSVALFGDLDGDGLPELVVGASAESAVYLLFLNADGTVRRHVRIADGAGGLPAATTGGDTFFGRSCAVVGDLDFNGVPDLIVGASADDTGSDNAGALYVLFLNPDGTVRSLQKIAHGLGNFPTDLLGEGDLFGTSCASLGDIDGNGFPDVVVGATGDDTGSADRGAVYLLSLGPDGTVIGDPKVMADGTRGLFFLSPGANFGSSVVALGDVNGDGVTDLAVGANEGASEGSAFGSVHVLFLDPDSLLLASTSKIANSVGGLPDNTIGDNNASFGFSLAVLGRSPDNGLPVLAVGSIGDNSGGTFAGAVFLLELGDPPLTVTTLVDEDDTPSLDFTGQLSLREAIRDADATGEFRTIRFDQSLSGGTTELNTGIGSLPVTTQSLRITGEGLVDGLTLSAGDLDRLFNLDDATLTVDSLHLRNANTIEGGSAFRVDADSRLVLDRVSVANCESLGRGGAIRSEGSVLISNSTFHDNTAFGSGGAIDISGAGADLVLLNSTFVRNSARTVVNGGGAIANFLGTVSVRHCTFVGNATDNVGGAILNDSGNVFVQESLFAGNTAPGGGLDFEGGITEVGGNAVDVPVSQLMPFGDYGGPTSTQPLKPTSPVKNSASRRTLPAFDQRGEGFPRTVGTFRDPGAVEGLESRDFQPDGRIGLSAARQIGNNVYNTSGQGQTVKLTLSGRKKTTSFFTVENDGLFVDGIRLRSVAPKKKTLKGSVFRLTGGRSNISAQVFSSGLALGDLNPGESLAFQADWSRKSATLKAKQTLKITASSTIALKSDVVGAKVGSK